ncbi:MAG: polysaccharide biosynthesis/export family protein [Acidobacteriia bacterium]|nr:polysaccharide biosynthesis/export family protein [Terriglobia bacterium]
MKSRVFPATLVLALLLAATGLVWAGNPGDDKPPAAAVAATHDSDYIIGAEDMLNVNVWKEAEMSATVPVRPDGKISLPLLNDVQAAGLTATQLAAQVTDRLKKYLEQPRVTVVVTQVNSRRYFVIGEVTKAGAYPLVSNITVLQGLSSAGGFTQFANSKNMYVLRVENGKQSKLPFNYHDVVKGRNAEQNILLKPGDTIVVP